MSLAYEYGNPGGHVDGWAILHHSNIPGLAEYAPYKAACAVVRSLEKFEHAANKTHHFLNIPATSNKSRTFSGDDVTSVLFVAQALEYQTVIDYLAHVLGDVGEFEYRREKLIAMREIWRDQLLEQAARGMANKAAA